MRKLFAKTRGFTLIELLIVIALIGILAVALLAAINPLEQLRKGRDTARQSDGAELLGALERHYASYQCYPWQLDASGECPSSLTALVGIQAPNFAAAGNVEELITRDELKAAFQNRDSVDATTPLICMSEDANNQVTICFEPESQTGRNNGLGDNWGSADGTGAATCTGNYVGGNCSTSAATCWVCVD